MNKKLLVFAYISMLASSLYADLYDVLLIDTIGAADGKSSTKITPDCVRPVKLRTLNDNRDVGRYNDELHKYVDCMNLFMSEQVKAANAAKDSKERAEHVAAIDNAKTVLDSYTTSRDVEQNQMHQHTVELDGLGFDDKLEKQKEKVKDK